MASRAKRKRQRREQKRIACMTNGERLIELFEKGAKGVDITSAIYAGNQIPVWWEEYNKLVSDEKA